ncbi:TolC family protein [Siphonobacter curvatus]|uniref:TolC family protein n=2 Tax=Siphonobacter curvatus TaxID=2094562 RepID=A0A2S7IHI3_9BACT|nr:TolC family protein [Siphonobacter curvatus]
MMQVRSLMIVGMLVILASPALEAQISDHASVLTLEKIWTIAAASNKQLKLASLRRQESDIRVLEARDKYLPELFVTGDLKLNSTFLLYENGLFSTPQDVPISKYGYGVGYSLNVDLYHGGRNRRAVEIKQEEQRQNQLDFDFQKNNVKYALVAAYYDLYTFLHFKDFIEAEIATEKKQLSTIENLSRNGVVLKSDVLRTSVKLSQLKLSQADLEKKIELAKQRLNLLMGRDGEERLEIPYQEPVLLDTLREFDYSDYLTIALHQSPEYKIVQSDVKLGELNLKQVKASQLPKISLFSNYNYTYPQISFYPYSNNLWGFGQTGLRTSFSLDNLYKSRHSMAHAHNLYEQEKEKSELKKDELISKVKDAYLQLKQALESVATAETSIAQSVESVRVIRNSYLNQESLLTDLLEAENVLLNARFTLIRAQATVKQSHIKLLLITGSL